jgi:hypothetical protein
MLFSVIINKIFVKISRAYIKVIEMLCIAKIIFILNLSLDMNQNLM